MSRFLRATACAALGAVALAASATTATAAADLVIVEQDSSITFESCEFDRPIATGLIAIKNIGDSRARLRLGLLTRYSRAMLAAYVPEHLDMIDNGYERSALDARDQASIKVEIGRSIQKRGRFPGTGAAYGSSGSTSTPSYSGGAAGTSGSLGATGPGGFDSGLVVDLTDLTTDERRDMQRALQDLGYFRGSINGQYDQAMRNAITAFQGGLGQQRTGELTVGQVEELSRQTGRALAIGAVGPASGGSVSQPRPTQPASGSGGGFGSTPVTIFVVVDPYNLVEESDETNNLVRFSGYIDCN